MAVDFIFVLSPNNSGTTIIGQYIQAQTGGYLPPFGNYEGQMVPSVRKVMRAAPWDPARSYDWNWIRKEWTALADDAESRLFIECSPPNILRVDQIRAAFDGAARYLFSISSPYSFVASVIYNYHRAPVSHEKVAGAARDWLFRADNMRKAIERHPDIPRIDYETFCADPGIVNAALGIEARSVGSLSGKKNEPVNEILDLSPRHYAFLTFSEWDVASAVLAERPDLLVLFGYDVLSGDRLLSLAAESPSLMHAGTLRRARWECRREDGGNAKPPRSVWSRWRGRMRRIWP